MYDTHKPELFVIKDAALGSPDKGVVRIVFTKNTLDGTISRPDHYQFPTGGIWISKGYEEIDQKFREGELFILDNYSPQSKDEIGYTQDHHDHWSTSTAVRPMDVNQMLPVIDAGLPDISSGHLNLNRSFPKGPFFIRHSASIYGPFTADYVDNEVICTPYSHVGLSISNHFVAKVDIYGAQEKEVYLTPDPAMKQVAYDGFVSSISQFSQQLKGEWKELDYISDTQLITFFAKGKMGKSSPMISRKMSESFKAVINDYQKKEKLLGNSERTSRLKKVLDKYLVGSSVGEEIIDEYLKSAEGKSFLTAYLADNPGIASNYLPDLNAKKEQLEIEIRDLQSRKQRKEQEIDTAIAREKAKAQQMIEEIRTKNIHEVQEERNRLLQSLESNIEEKKQALESIDQQTAMALDKLKVVDDIQELKGEVNFLQRRERELEDIVKAREAKLKSPDLPRELTEVKTILDLLQGNSYEVEVKKAKPLPVKMMSVSPDNGAQIVQSMVDAFDHKGRAFSFEEMANLLITVQQSFLTVFKGLPGSGKTSTAIRLAQAYHLRESDSVSDHFLNIPVSRGWVSGRDLLGFYNSLKGSYQPAKSGLYQFLRQGQEEQAAQLLRLVLLDEANLSPMEHYWSDFLAMCDTECRFRQMDTGMPGDDRFLSASANLRFIATINNDHTTEPLSPRLCDRVPVISMDIPHMPTAREFGSLVLDGAIPFPQLDQYFGLPQELAVDAPPVLSGCYDILEARDRTQGNPVLISQRKRNAMLAYYEVACRYLDRKDAADFALSQHGIPLINGHGKQFLKRLDKLREHAMQNSLTRTTLLIDDIMANGDNYAGTYSFY
ncbi:ATP-binding protein [Endozoicomonas ascidiicola]|uniref:ATP-binding protein n=1 Tax=Endozoicomonas ascidiicola TaxID=1698521 RepID=UPI00082C3265|nr:ATP-binding protein [Endozoicomonas ascidiicola]